MKGDVLIALSLFGNRYWCFIRVTHCGLAGGWGTANQGGLLFPNGVVEENGHLTWDIRKLFSNVVMGIGEAFREFPEI